MGKKKCNHPKESLAKPGDILRMCPECGDMVVDVDGQRKLIDGFHHNLNRIPFLIKRFFR